MQVDKFKSKYVDKPTMSLLRKATNNKVRDRTLVEMLYLTGVRVSELADILKEDILWDEKLIFIRSKNTDTERFVPFPLILGELIEKYLVTRSDNDPHLFVNKFGRRFDPRQIRRLFHRYSRKLGLENSVLPSQLRSTLIFELAQNGVSSEAIASLLGVSPLNNFSLKFMKG